MSKFVGTIERTDVEGGQWLLRTDQGVVYQLKGAPAAMLVEGRRVEVSGAIAEGSFGLAMMGDVLEVESHRFLD
jgi:hypothetical protein